MTPSTQSSILSMLHGRASLRPDDIAFTFTDYTNSPTGVAESLTWSQLSRHTFNVARELGQHASPGDRALILAPQSLEYILAFLGSMQAGLIAVPLPLPHRGSSLDRVSAVFDDTSPSVVLTTSAVASDVGDYVDQSRLEIAPKLIEIDTLRLDVDAGPSLVPGDVPNIAYLQYSSGSTRTPTGVMLSHRNLQVNFEQLMRSFFVDTGCTIPSNATIVSWLPFYHDMGLVLGVCAPILGGYRADLTSPLAFLESPSRWVRALATNPHAWSSAPNFAFDLAARKTTDADLAGLDLGGVLGIISGAERVEQATLQRFVDRFAHFNFRDSMMRPSYGLAEATVFVASGTWKRDSTRRPLRRRGAVGGPGAAVRGRGRNGAGPVQGAALPVLRIIDSDTHRECPADVVGEIWVHGDNVASGYWRKSPRNSGASARRSPTRLPAPRGPGSGPAISASCPRASCSSSAASRTCSSSAGATTTPRTSRPPFRRSAAAGSRPSRFRSTAPRSWSPSSSSRSAAIPTSRPSGAKSPRRSRMRTG